LGLDDSAGAVPETQEPVHHALSHPALMRSAV